MGFPYPTTPTVHLRPYQSRAVAAVRAHWERGARAVVVVAPTGAGKTTIAAALEPDLVLVHTLTLRAQAIARIPGAPTVLTIQAALRPDAAAALKRARVVWIDECHHLAPGGTWAGVLALLPPDCRVVGTTATPERADGAPLGDVFGALVTTVGYQELLRDGHLAPCEVVCPPASRPAAQPGTAAADAYIRFGGARPGQWRSGIIFLPKIADCNAAVLALLRAGVRAAVIDCTTPTAHREWAVAAYNRGELEVLASPTALAEGFDSPRAAVCVLGRRCEHVSTYLQAVNRVTRPHPSKDPSRGGVPALLVDLTGASERHGHPLEDREYGLQGTAIGRRPAQTPPRPAAARPSRPAPVAPRQVVAAARATWHYLWAALRAVW